jgi:uncharacterized protein (TIGR02246 family)
MTDDEQAIRDLVTAWLEATAAGDLPKVLSLMADDAVFLMPGRPPMRGREAFAAAFQAGASHVRIDGKSEIQEIEVAGDFAYFWSHLSVTVTPRQGGSPMHRSGFTLTVLRKQPEGNWLLVRDANMLTADTSPAVDTRPV